MKTIICHASNKLLTVLKPMPPNDAIFFSQDCFLTCFGQYLYLFDLDVLMENFNMEKNISPPLISLKHPLKNANINEFDRIYFYGQKLKAEWQCKDEIDVKKYSLGVIKHVSPYLGKVELLRGGVLLDEIVLDLDNYNGELRGCITKDKSEKYHNAVQAKRDALKKETKETEKEKTFWKEVIHNDTRNI